MSEVKDDPVSREILAQVLFDLDPSLTVEQWIEYIKKNGHDPKAFFGNNGAGYNEYVNFVSSNDKDKHMKIKQQQQRSR